MSLSSYIDLTAEQEKLFKKMLRKYQGATAGIIATPYKFLSREQIAERKNRQWMTEVAASWHTLDTTIQAVWKANAVNISRNGWQLYMQEYCYRKKYELSLPPTPNQYHQMMGLQISNPTGSGVVQAQRYDIVLTGPISLSFNFKKVENAPTGGLPFRVHAIAYYFEGGENKYEEYTYDFPSGNLDWQNKSFSFGTSGRYYFECIISLVLDNYNADVVIDNFVLSDMDGTVVNEPWHIKAGKVWIYQPRTRKMGWEFSPAIGVPYIQVVYTGG